MFVQLVDVRLFFDVEGAKLVPDGSAMREKPTLLLLHGGPSLDHSTFRPAFSALSDLAQVIYLDQRGHGRSERSEAKHWSLGQWAEDVYAFCQALKIERPIVLGTSFGGYVAMAYAIRYPEHPAKLILVSTSARGTAIAARQVNMRASFERVAGKTASLVAQKAFDERTLEAFEEYSRVCGPFYNPTPPHPDAVKRTVRNADVLLYFERAEGEGAIFDFTSDLPLIRCPTLVISGDEDPITPVKEQQVIVNSMQPGLATHLRFPKCGHGVLRDNAAGLIRAVADFVSDKTAPHD
jgi:pimeloyl-ACP methyl ester carboxylesterase